jgi:hypothetical protein
MVPWVPQHTSSALCFPASLQMVLQFYLDHHDDRRKLAGMTRPSLDELVVACNTSLENGTKISADLTTRLGAIYPLFEFELARGCTLVGAQTYLAKGIPLILIYDGEYFLTEVRGPGHAGVFVGSAPNADPILNNPWLGQGYVANRVRFDAAWEIRGKKAVIVKFKSQRTLEDADSNGGGAVQDY